MRSPRLFRGAVVVLTLVVALSLGTGSAWALITPVKILGAPAVQFRPYRNASWLLYASNSTAKPRHYNAYARNLTTAHTVRLNAPLTEGFTGGFDPGTNRAIYQQIAGSSSDIYVYNLDTGLRKRVQGVNTSSWEYDPRISDTYISFIRYYRAGGSTYKGIYLYNRITKRLRRIASYKAGLFVDNGAVGDRYATWTTINKSNDFIAYIYDKQTKVLRKIPTVNGRPQYAPVVDETNEILFFVRSGNACGFEVKFFSLPVAHLGTTPTKIASLPAGVDVEDVSSLALNADASAFDLLFTRAPCKGGWDLYALPGVSPGPT